ncbi:MAG: hypothetical protein U0414_18000 [Polyangiaceae bacterium]
MTTVVVAVERRAGILARVAELSRGTRSALAVAMMNDRSLRTILSIAALTLVACGDSKNDGAASASPSGAAASKASASATASAAPRVAIDLANTTDDKVKAAVVAAGFKDPFVYHPEPNSSYGSFEVSLKEPKARVVVYNFSAGVQAPKRVPFVNDFNDKRILSVDASLDFADAGFVTATADVLKKSGCTLAAECGKALKDAGYGEISGADSRSQIGATGYSYITASKGGKYVQVQVHDLKHEKFDTVVRVAPPFVVIALPDGDAPVPRAELQKLADAFK